MRAIILAALVATSTAVTLRQMSADVSVAQWPSVAKCTKDQISTDSHPCDHDNRMEHNHDGTAIQTGAAWPSVAKCGKDGISTDSHPCDHDNRREHNHDGTTIQTEEAWPSVAKCGKDGMSTDSHPCDHDNRREHPHDGTTLQLEYRPVIKCIDPIHGNPISCDHDDIADWSADAKDENGFTPTKIVLGGPSVDLVGPAEKAAAAAAAGKK